MRVWLVRWALKTNPKKHWTIPLMPRSVPFAKTKGVRMPPGRKGRESESSCTQSQSGATILNVCTCVGKRSQTDLEASSQRVVIHRIAEWTRNGCHVPSASEWTEGRIFTLLRVACRIMVATMSFAACWARSMCSWPGWFYIVGSQCLNQQGPTASEQDLD